MVVLPTSITCSLGQWNIDCLASPGACSWSVPQWSVMSENHLSREGIVTSERKWPPCRSPLRSNAYKTEDQHGTIDLGPRNDLRRLGVLINRLGNRCTTKLNAWAFDRCFVCQNRPRKSWFSLAWKTSLVFAHYLFLPKSGEKSAQGILGVRIMTWESFSSIGWCATMRKQFLHPWYRSDTATAGSILHMSAVPGSDVEQAR